MSDQAKALQFLRTKLDHDSFRVDNVKVQYEKQLGKGGFASVYEATIEGKNAAAKQLHVRLQSVHQYAINRFVEECQHLKKTTHPNIVQFYGVHFDQCESLPLLIMERMETSAHEWIVKKERIQRDRDIVLQDITQGLAYLHSHNLVHRDLTAGNVLLNLTPLRAKLSDLGMARVIEDGQSLTMAPGTRCYMAPETFGQQYTNKVDIYSFGVLMMFVLTQTLPLEKPARELLSQKKAAGFDQTAFIIIERCLCKNPDFRPSCDELREWMNNPAEKPEPSWKKFLIKGLSVIGTCETEHCIAQGEEVPCYIKDHCFNLAMDSPQLQCPECNKYMDPKKCVLHECSGTINGKVWYSYDQQIQEHANEGLNPNDIYEIVPGPNGGRWLELTVKANIVE